MNLEEELKLTKERWIAIGERLGALKQESDGLQVQARQLEGRYALLEEQIKEKQQRVLLEEDKSEKK